MFGNPVPGRIQAKSEPWDRTSFRVTATFQDHKSRVPPVSGIDFGNGRQGADVYAAAKGVVIQTFKDLGNGALIVRVDHGNLIGGKKTVTGYAHVATFAVKVGQAVARGQKIATVGMTGASAPHLHWGVNVGGVEVDGWPLLDQNQQGGIVDTTTRIYPSQRTWRAKGGNLTGYPLVVGQATKTVNLNAGSAAHSDAQFTIEPEPPGWPQSPFQRVIDGVLKGYYIANSAVNLDPEPQPGGGDTAAAEKKGAQDSAAAAKKYADSLP
jgi:murein DD-endopeptidase MepM/ murein hydrolase activator NlpD